MRKSPVHRVYSHRRLGFKAQGQTDRRIRQKPLRLGWLNSKMIESTVKKTRPTRQE